MTEFKKKDVSEVQNAKPEGFKEIKPQGEANVDNARSFWDNLFEKTSDIVNDIKEELDNHYTSRQERIDCAAKSNGTWTGEPGNSKFIPTDKTDEGLAAREKLSEYGMDGIVYKDGIPDFSKVSSETVKIDMTSDRLGNNYPKAYKAVQDKWNNENRNERSDWTIREVKDWKQANGLSPHECIDTKTVMFVPTAVHSEAKHFGGVAECKARDNVNGGDFDE